MRDAVAAAHGTMPPVPAEAPLAPPTVANPVPVHAPTAVPAIPAVAPLVGTPTRVSGFSISSVSASPAAAPAASPVTDSSGLKAFVGRIRGLDHLELPRVLDGGTPPLARAPAAPASPVISSPAGFLDVDAIRRDFPILKERVHGKPLAWFDNAATTQKPQAVIDAISRFYAHDNSNIHRGAHTLAARATDAYEHARQTIADFLGANGPEEIIYVRAAPRGSTCARTFSPRDSPAATRSCSRNSSTTPTSCPGRWWPSGPAP